MRTLSLVLTCLLAALSARAADLTCPSATTLETLAVCIRSQMPARDSNAFEAPTVTEQTDWRVAVGRMMSGQCNFELPASLAGAAAMRTFSDSENGRSYCLLMEIADANGNGVVDRGWGTFIVDNGAVRELSHQAPHPIADSTTEVQAIGVFKSTGSRSYLLAGAHRNANGGSSSCQDQYAPADAAHNTENMFHATNLELVAHYGASAWTAIQWHGMAADTCPSVEVYLSHGRAVVPLPDDRITALRSNLLRYHADWKIDAPGTGACSLNATENTQGRLLNGVDASNVCRTAAGTYSGRFIHIEQDPGFRSASDWTWAVIDTFPASAKSSPRRRSVRSGLAKLDSVGSTPTLRR